MGDTPRMKVTAVAPWYGSNRTLAGHVGRLLAGCSWVGVPFAGGMCELAHLDARTLLVGDLHRHVLNLAACLAWDDLRGKLATWLAATPFHPDALALSQREAAAAQLGGLERPDVRAAYHYFVCAWMGRNGAAGTPGEFRAGLSVRWDAGGGDSATRFRHAAESLAAWSAVMRRCTFVCLDVFDFLARVKDRPDHGLYLDPPFPGPGDGYRHRFGDDQHRRLAEVLRAFTACRVVCRFYDHPLIRELYPEPLWTWHRPAGGRTQANKAAPEVLLTTNLTPEGAEG